VAAQVHYRGATTAVRLHRSDLLCNGPARGRGGGPSEVDRPDLSIGAHI
jgi:hypothetical protein